MDALEMAQSAYTKSAPVRSAQASEYHAFARITEKLKTHGRNRKSFGLLAAAIADNRRLWSILAADVANADNQLPSDLRARIFYLAEFSNHHSRLVLKGEADITPLVEINAAIMAGLRNQIARNPQQVRSAG